MNDATTRLGRHPLVRPPTLRTGRDGSASRLELFFDLAYVLVVIELAHGFTLDLTWHGFAVVAGLFAAIWLSWVGFTLYANRFDTDDVVFRLVKLTATAAVGGCAAAASDAVGKFAVPFAACFLVGRILLLVLYARAWRHVPQGRPTIVVYLVCLAMSSAIWAASLVVPGDLRYAFWAVAVLVDAVGPIAATLRDDRLPLRLEHLPERFGLLIILVLGEALGGVVRGLHDSDWAAPSLSVGIAGLVVASALWWVYFDVASEVSADRLDEAENDPEPGEEESKADERHDMFVYGHLPLAFGTVLVGVGLEDLVVHRDAGAEWVFAGGVTFFLLGITLVIAGTTRRLDSVWPWPLAFIAAVPLMALLPLPNALTFTWAAAVILIVLAAHGTIVSRRPTVLAGASEDG